MREHKNKIIITCIVLLLIAPIDSVNMLHNLLTAVQSLVQSLHLH